MAKIFNKKFFIYFDYTLFIFVVALAIFGTIVIGSATKINIYGESSQFTGQIIWLIVGVFLMLAAVLVDYHLIARFYLVFYGVNIFLLILVLLKGTGDGVSRWIFGIQPSEFSKLFMVIFLAKAVDRYQERINSLPVLLILIAADLIPAMLIKMQPSLSASLVTIVILVAMLFLGKISFKYIGIVGLIFIVLGIVFIIDILSGNHIILSKFLNPYQISRIDGAINFDLTGNDSTTYQTRNSVWAIGSGQLRGKGLYNGTVNQLNYLPESHNDFIFAVVGEEFGFVGCVGVLAAMFVIIVKMISIAWRAMDNLGLLIVGGVCAIFAFQTFVNVGVATGLLPNTGMPFPLLSYGGSAMIVNMLCVGLVLNVGIRKPKSLFER